MKVFSVSPFDFLCRVDVTFPFTWFVVSSLHFVRLIDDSFGLSYVFERVPTSGCDMQDKFENWLSGSPPNLLGVTKCSLRQPMPRQQVGADPIS